MKINLVTKIGFLLENPDLLAKVVSEMVFKVFVHVNKSSRRNQVILVSAFLSVSPDFGGGGGGGHIHPRTSIRPLPGFQ